MFFTRLLFKFFNFVTLFFNIFEFMDSHYFQSAAQPEAVSSEVKSFISFLFFLTVYILLSPILVYISLISNCVSLD